MACNLQRKPLFEYCNKQQTKGNRNMNTSKVIKVFEFALIVFIMLVVLYVGAYEWNELLKRERV